MDWGSALGGAMKGINEGIDLGNKIKNSWLEDDKRQLAEEELAYKMRPISYQETDTWKQMTEPQRVAAASALGGKQQASQAEWGRIQETIGRDQKIALDNMAYAEKTTPVDVKELFPSWDNYNEQFKTAILSKAKDGKMTRYDADKLKAYYKDDQEVQALNAEADIKTAKQELAKLVRERNGMADNDPRVNELDARIASVQEKAVSAQDLMIISGYKAMAQKITHGPTRQAADAAIRAGDGVRLQTIVDGWINDSRDSESKMALERLRIKAVQAAQDIKDPRTTLPKSDMQTLEKLLINKYSTIAGKDEKGVDFADRIRDGIRVQDPFYGMSRNQYDTYNKILDQAAIYMTQNRKLPHGAALDMAITQFHNTKPTTTAPGGQPSSVSAITPSPVSALEKVSAEKAQAIRDKDLASRSARDKEIEQTKARVKDLREKTSHYRKVLLANGITPSDKYIQRLLKGDAITQKNGQWYIGNDLLDKRGGL